MGRAPCCEKVGLKRGRWTAEEDEILINYIKQNGDGSWRSLPKNAGLLRCGKSCRLRWINYLRGDLKRGNFTREEEETIIKLHRSVGNKWSLIASNLPGRTDNEVKNYWNSHLSRKIYCFRSSCNGAMLNTIDMVKTTTTTTTKRKGGRVSRAVAKKYNMNAAINARAIGTISGNQEKAGKAEVKTSIDDMKSLEEKGRENDVPGPDDDVSLLLEQILEGDLMDLGEISWETGENLMDDHPRESGSSVNNANESDNGDMYECFSPLNSYFNYDLQLSWDKEYNHVHEFALWDGDDGLLWP